MNINWKVAALFVGMGLASLVNAQVGIVAPGAGGSGAIAGSQAGALAGSTAGAGAAAGIDLQQTFQATQPLATTTLREEHSGTYTLRTAPTIGVPNIFPTAPCMGSSALGVSVVGTGVSGGTSWVYENCEHRENARLLQAFGDIPNAKIALCMQTTMTEHPMCKAMAPKPAAQPAKVSSVDQRDPRIISSDQNKADSMIRTKSRDDAAFTKAAMAPTEKERLEANCAYATKIGDTILASRFGCPSGK